MFSNKLFNISEFAKISGVTRQTLIYYDRIGLFSPAVVADNKYRKYSHGQIATISAITILRDLGVPLKKIKNYITDVSPKKTVEILNYQLKIINDKIDELSSLKNMLSLRINQIHTGQAGELNRYSLQTVENKIPFFVGKEINCKHLDISDDIMIDFFKTVEKKKIPLIFAIGYLKTLPAESDRNDFYVNRMCFRLKDEKNANFFMPEGQYLVTYGKGDYGDTDVLYGNLLNYAKEEGLSLTGPFYEEYLIDELAEKSPSDFILKISVKVE